MRHDRAFTPWRANRIQAAVLAVLGVTTLGVSTLFGGDVAVAGAAIAFTLFAAAWTQRRTAKRREFGKQFEAWAVRSAFATIRPESGVTLQAAVTVGSREDVDIVASHEGAAVPIEIKSFVRWKTYFWRLYGARERKTIRQSRRQAKFLRAKQSVIWLPQGRKGYWQKFARYPNAANGVVLVFGDARQLQGALHAMLGNVQS